jgi:CheY-like chemotaxis protein
MDDQAPILVAEDEETEIMILRMAASRAGLAHKLAFVKDGAEVLAYLQGNPPFTDRSQHPFPALLLLDLKMPNLTGFDVLEWIAARPELKHLPVVVLSASPDDSDIKKATNLGARDYHIKPHRLPDLVAILKSINDRWLTSPSSPTPSNDA